MTEELTTSGDMPKAYDPAAFEEKLYRFWEDGGYFIPKIDPEKPPFTIIMPPPNVSGDLHLGSVLFVTLEDVLTRWHRMRQEPSLWLPGQDHAAIATQNVVERELAGEGVSRHDLGREKFLERVWEWVNQYRGKIRDQLKRLGASCDWTRECFTLDPGPAKAVRTTFVKLYNDGLIYRGERIANWCPRCHTAISDLEVEHQESQGHLWYVRYPLLDDAGQRTGEYVTIATTRPETILADVAVAVNPADERYKSVVGQKVLLPIVERHIPVVADDAVDPAFGTGALKITPGHDVVDFEVGQRHNLETIVCIALDATMTEDAGRYKGMDRFECRTAIVKDLEDGGYLVKTEPYTHSIGHCQRCHTLVEPLVSKQWFLNMAPLAAPAIEAVTSGRIQFVPDRFTKVYLNWMENIRDWCISRQLWFGHSIPVWYCRDCDGQTVTVEDPEVCQHCGSRNIERDPDVLDTWFSSALWPHSTLGWPDDTEDLRYFYPTGVMETGYDIIFFWVARMIMMGLYNMKEIPFRHVYLHGLVRDEYGQKISKSKITTKHHIPSPLEAIESYGADALRYALATAGTPGNDLRISEQRMEAGRNFANKLWNATRFVISHLDGEEIARPSLDGRASLPLEDRWILSRLNTVIANVNQLLTDFQLGEAGRQVHDFFWGEYCDWYLEMAKVRLAAGDRSPLPVLVHALDAALRLLHPFMPFVTEAAWQSLAPHLAEPGASALIAAPYPTANPFWWDQDSEKRIEAIVDVVHDIRDRRAHELKVPAAERLPRVVIELAPALALAIQAKEGLGRLPASGLDDRSPPWSLRLPLQRTLLQAQIDRPESLRHDLERFKGIICALARVRTVEVTDQFGEVDPQEVSSSYVSGLVNVIIPLAGTVNVEAERGRLNKQIIAAEAEVERLRSKLANQEFLAKAPAAVVDKEKEKLDAAQARVTGLQERLRQIA
jgi:valyl-tRNA synthetase